MKIVVDNKIPYIKGVFEPYADVAYLAGSAFSVADVADADVLLVRTRTRCDASLLSGSKVRLVATATIGTDHIDLAWCAQNGIEVVSAPGSNAGGVLQWVSAALARIVTERGCAPASLTLGVVGVGHVGSLVEQYALSWGFCVLRSDPPRERAEGLGRADGYVPLAELASHSDLITFHVPLTREGEFPTLLLGGESFFANLKKGAVVLNSSRGGVVDEGVLKRKLIAGSCTACLDTWVGEPAIELDLLDRVLFGTPHIAGYSMQGKANASAMIVDVVARRFSLPLTGWYPKEVQSMPRRAIEWHELCGTIDNYFDIEQETALLKEAPERFETFREGYHFRQEYF